MHTTENVLFLDTSSGRELEGCSFPEEISEWILEELFGESEPRAFEALLFEGDRRLLRKVLEEKPEPELHFPLGEPDLLIVEERLRRNAPALQLSLPLRESASPRLLGTAALLGGLSGWIFSLLLGSGTVGAPLAGGALGAAGAFWIAEKLRSSPGLRRALAGLFGVGALSEIFRILPSSGWLGLMRRSSRGFSPLRFLGMLLAIPLVMGCSSRAEIHREMLEPQLRELLLQRCAFYGLALRGEYLFEYLRQKNLENVEDLPDLASLGASLYALAGASSETLPEAAEEVLRSAREAGFEDLPLRREEEDFSSSGDLPRYWSEELRDSYDTVGYLEPGEPVRVERLPAFYRGVLQTKGLLRREKRRNPS